MAPLLILIGPIHLSEYFPKFLYIPLETVDRLDRAVFKFGKICSKCFANCAKIHGLAGHEEFVRYPLLQEFIE
jgi:hypothetical protein